MRYGLLTVVLILFAGLTTRVNAQQGLFKNYTVNDGLVSNNIRRVFQDAKGFIWIATIEGLSKYDGHTFKNYSTSNGLSHNLVNDFYESKQGQLYVALNNGNIDIITDDKITSKAVSSAIVVNRFVQTPWQQVIATTDGKGFQQFTGGRLTRPVQDFPSSTYSDIAVINDTAFMVSGENVIRVFNKKYKLITETKKDFTKFSDLKIYPDSKKRIWVGTSTGLKLITGLIQKNNPVTYTPLPAPFNTPALLQTKINDILEDADGVIWFATTSGIVKINTDGSQQIITTKDGLSSNFIISIFQDREKNIWFGTALGLSKLVTRSGIRLYPMENGVWTNDNSYLFYQFKKNDFLVGTFNGVKVFNKQTGNFTPVINSKSDFFFSAIPKSNPPLLFGSRKMAVFDTLGSYLQEVPTWSPDIGSRMVRNKAGNFFTGNLTRLFFSSSKKQLNILDYRITALLIDKGGSLWAATWENGLFRFEYNDIADSFKILKADHFLPKENIRSLFEDSKGNIWAGSRYQGVYRFIKNEKENFTVTNFNQRSGLTSNWIKGIREDVYGNYWIAFYHGLDKLIVSDSSIRIFNFSRINNYFTSIIGIDTDADHTIWLATGEGLVQLTDGELEKAAPLPVYITKIFSPDSIYSLHTKNLHLNNRKNQIQFEFSSPGYINEKQILYSYRLYSNTPAEWSAATSQHVVSYASLLPSGYRFEVRSLGWNGAWGEPAVFEFTINPPFWKTWWFISIAAFCTLLLSSFFIRWRIKNIKTIAAEKLKVQQLNAEQYKSKLELEQIINYFSSSLVDKNKVGDVLWDVAKNLIGRLGFIDCMLYGWNADKTKMIQQAGFGPKGSAEEINKRHFDVLPGQGVVGYVMETKEAVLIPDTSTDSRYRADEMVRLSEITVPVIYNNELIGIIDSEHPEKNFYNARHLQILNTIGTLMANKIKSIEAEQSLQQTAIEMYSINEQLVKAKLEALQSQMNPHFIFNSLNSIDNLIQTNQKERATTYLARFAKLIRNVLDCSKNDVVAFQKDYETLQLYLQMEQFRCSDKFTWQLLAEDELLHSDFKILPLIVQPFVENAIHHGLLNKQHGDRTLTVSAVLENDYIKYSITDNGVGRVKAQQLKEINKPEHQSYGINITKERIQLYNKNTENNHVAITDLFDKNEPCGTRVEIKIKIFENT